VLAPGFSQAILDLLDERGERLLGLLGGLEALRLAEIGARAIERAVAPAGERQRGVAEIALARQTGAVGELVLSLREIEHALSVRSPGGLGERRAAQSEKPERTAQRKNGSAHQLPGVTVKSSK